MGHGEKNCIDKTFPTSSENYGRADDKDFSFLVFTIG